MEPTDDTKTNALDAHRERLEQMNAEIHEERKRAELTIVREIARRATDSLSITDLAIALRALRPAGIMSAPDVATLRHRVEVAALTTLEKFLPHTNTQHASEALAALAQHPR